MLSKFYGWLLYKAFIYISRRVTFADFTKIWNEAYASHVEAEWKRLQLINCMNDKSQPGEWEGLVGVKLSELPSVRISPRLDLRDGQIGQMDKREL